MQKKLSKVSELEQKLEQSQKDKEQLSKFIQQLNQCYQMKISYLTNTVQAYESRLEELLQWKKQSIDKQLSTSSKYELQNKKLLNIVDQLYKTFDEEKSTLKKRIQKKDQQINKIIQEKDDLMIKSEQHEQRIDQLVKKHMKQIDQLKKQLSILKEEVVEESAVEGECREEINKESEFMDEGQPDSIEFPLKQIQDMNIQYNRPFEDETRIKQFINGNIQINTCFVHP